MKAFFLHSLIFFLFYSCSQNQDIVEQTFKISLRGKKALSVSRGAVGYGGAMIWGQRVDGIEGFMAVPIPPDATQVSLEIPSGIWEFAMMAWTGTEDETDNYPDTGLLTGTPFCDFTDPVEVSGDDAAISLDISAASSVENDNCFEPIFGDSSLVASSFAQAASNPNAAIASYPVSRFSQLNLVTCSTFDDLDLNAGSFPDKCSFPSSYRGRYSSFEIELLGIDPLSKSLTAGIRSECLANATGGSINHFLSKINLPGRFPVKIYAYDNSDCEEESGSSRKEFLFSAGLETPGEGFDHFYLPYGSGPNKNMGLHLPDSISGSGFSPFADITPAYTCYVSSENGQPCTADQNFDRRFEAVIDLTMASGTGPYNFRIPQRDLPDGISNIGTCNINVSAASVPNSHVSAGSCSCTAEYCDVDLSSSATCSGLCTKHNQVVSSKNGDFHIEFDGGSVYSQYQFSLVDGRMKNTLETIWAIAGHPDGNSSTDYTDFEPDEDTREEGVIGVAFELLGASTVGGILYSQGINTCAQATAGEYEIVVEDGDEVETATIKISSEGTSIIPHYIFKNLPGELNYSNITFDKKMEIQINDDEGQEKILLEFNCEDTPAGFETVFAGHGVLNHFDTENGEETTSNVEFYYSAGSTSDHEEFARAELFRTTKTLGKLEQWEAIRLLKFEDSLGAAASFPVLSNRSYGYNVKVEHNIVSDTWNQQRIMFAANEEVARIADEAFSGVNFTPNSALGIPSNLAPFDTGNIIRKMENFDDTTTTTTIFNSLTLISTTDFDLGEGSPDTVQAYPSLDPNGAFHMNWVGQKIVGGECDGKTAMECKITEL